MLQTLFSNRKLWWLLVLFSFLVLTSFDLLGQSVEAVNTEKQVDTML